MVSVRDAHNYGHHCSGNDLMLRAATRRPQAPVPPPYKAGPYLSSFVSTVSTRAVDRLYQALTLCAHRSIFSSGCNERAVQNSPLLLEPSPCLQPLSPPSPRRLLPVTPRCPRYPSHPQERAGSEGGTEDNLLRTEAARNPTAWTVIPNPSSAATARQQRRARRRAGRKRQ